MRWESYLRSEIVRVIFQPLIILIIGFDFLFRHILNDFNIVLVSGAESVMAEIKDIFWGWIELFWQLHNVPIEIGSIDFFPVPVALNMLR